MIVDTGRISLAAARGMARSWARPVGSITLWALAWLVLADVLVASGALWAVLGEDLGQQRRYSLQAQLFDDPPPETVGLLVVGDRAFVRDLQFHRPDLMAEAYAIAIPQFSLADLSAIGAALRGHSVEVLVIQSSPHMWTDYWFREPALNTTLWRGYGAMAGPSLNRLSVVLSVLRQAVEARPADPSTPDRPKSLLATHPSDQPRNANAIERDVKVLVGDVSRVTWLRDDRMTPEDTPSAVRDAFEARMDAGGALSELGQVVQNPRDLAPRDKKSDNVR